MTLDPDLFAMLQRSQADAGPPLQDMLIEQARTALREMFLANGYPLRHPVEVNHIPSEELGNRFDIHVYRPNNAHHSRPPALVYFHGGGFVLGDAAAYDIHSRALAYLLGAVVIFVGYRRAPEHKFPAAHNDAFAAMDWLNAAAEDLDIDTNRMVLMGESAGGNLAVNAAIHAHKTTRLSFRGLSLVYPVTDMRPFTQTRNSYPSLETYSEGTNLNRDEMQWFCDTYLNDHSEGTLPENTLFLHPDLNILPPTRIYTAECDPLRDMGMDFATRLIEHDIDARAKCFPGMLHSFMCHGGISPKALRHFFSIVEDLSEQLQPERHRVLAPSN